MFCKDACIKDMAALLVLREECPDYFFKNDEKRILRNQSPFYEEDIISESQKDQRDVVYYREYLQCSIRDNVNLEVVRTRHGELRERAKLSAHLRAAKNAIACLRSQNIYFIWEISEYHCIRYYDLHPFVVHSRSDRHIRGRYNGNADHRKPYGIRRNFAVVVSCLYGASHLSVWKFRFPTTVEMRMWRASCITLVGVPVLTGMFFFSRGAESRLIRVGRYAAPDKGKIGRSRRYLGTFFLALFGLLDGVFIAYVLANGYPLIRLYLLTESLASLRSPANVTYESTDWTLIIPHVSLPDHVTLLVLFRDKRCLLLYAFGCV